MTKNIKYGIGLRFEEYLISVENPLDNVVALVDKAVEKQGQSIDGINICSPNEICQMSYDFILISSDKYYSDIKDELILAGCDEKKIKKLEYKASKYTGELAYWRSKYRKENEHFNNSGYKDLFLGIADESTDNFMGGKIVADFGYGPRGSLAWTSKPSIKIGIDVLANAYMRYFGECMIDHGMIYLNCDEYRIPLPSNYVDILSSINSLDHVDLLDNMIEEICRILKPGGLFLGSFNLNEPTTQCEPQTLTIDILNEKLLSKFEVQEMKIAHKGTMDTYSEISSGMLLTELDKNDAGEMWIRAIMK